MSKISKKMLIFIVVIFVLSQIWFPIRFWKNHVTKRNLFVKEIVWDAEKIVETAEILIEEPTEVNAENLRSHLEQFLFHEMWSADALRFDWLKEDNVYRVDWESIEIEKAYRVHYFPVLESAADGQLTEDEKENLRYLQETMRQFLEPLVNEEGNLKLQAYDEKFVSEQLSNCINGLDLYKSK